jgi:hypothetical protein
LGWIFQFDRSGRADDLLQLRADRGRHWYGLGGHFDRRGSGLRHGLPCRHRRGDKN